MSLRLRTTLLLSLSFFFTSTLALADSLCTERVSVKTNGSEGNNFSSAPSISADGYFVAFYSFADNLVDCDINLAGDVFVHNRQTGTTSRVSVKTDGTQGNGMSTHPSISPDGGMVAFASEASNLVDSDTNGYADILVRESYRGTISRVSVKTDGTQGNGGSFQPSISAEGGYIAFVSEASNLVDGDTNETYDVFVHDRQIGVTSRVSVKTDGTQGNGGSFQPSISADGRYIAFLSEASNLVAGDTNGAYDVFVHDRQTGAISRVSVASDGAQGDNYSHSSSTSISADGRFVAFVSGASNLVAGDTNGAYDVFVHDRQTGATSRVSVKTNGTEGNGISYPPSISADGRFVAFVSQASNLVAGDTNETHDVFVHDRQTGITSRVSVQTNGTEGNSYSDNPSISPDGRYIAFESQASNLVAGDTNGFVDVFVCGLLSFSDSSFLWNMFLPAITGKHP
jgi:Tol biopolymer transport system component